MSSACSRTPKTATVSDKLSECEALEVGPCETKASGAGNVTIGGIATLAYIKKSTKQVAVVLPIAETKIYCQSEISELKGSIILPITPVNTKTTTLEMKIHQTGAGKQEFTKYENEKGELVTANLKWSSNNGIWFEAALEVIPTVKLTTAKSITISA